MKSVVTSEVDAPHRCNKQEVEVANQKKKKQLHRRKDCDLRKMERGLHECLSAGQVATSHVSTCYPGRQQRKQLIRYLR